jgi:RNA polymerase sigma-70 factor (ECF subfamily)
MPDWTAAYLEHGPLVLGYLRRRLGRREDAEDLLQETFARVLRSGATPRDETKTRAYLLSTAHNLLVNHRRRRRDLVQSESDLGRVAPLEDAPDDAHPVPATVEFRDLCERVEEILATLPADQARAFRMGVLQRRPYREISAITGWSPSKVKVAVFRARKALIAALRRQDGSSEGERT